MNSGMPGCYCWYYSTQKMKVPFVHIVCLQNDFEISNEALRSVERKEKDRIQENRDGWVGRKTGEEEIIENNKNKKRNSRQNRRIESQQQRETIEKDAT